MVTRYFAHETVRLRDSSPTEFHVIYAIIQLYSVCDRYRYRSRMNSQMSVLTVTIGKECSRRSVPDAGEVSISNTTHFYSEQVSLTVIFTFGTLLKHYYNVCVCLQTSCNDMLVFIPSC